MTAAGDAALPGHAPLGVKALTNFEDFEARTGTVGTISFEWIGHASGSLVLLTVAATPAEAIWTTYRLIV